MRDAKHGCGFVRSIVVFLCGLLMLELAGFTNASATVVAITAPTYGSTVSATVPIKIWMHSGCSWTNVYVDGVYLASTPNPIAWASTSVADGSHTITATAYNASKVVLGKASRVVRVKNRSPSSTPSSTSTPPPTGTPTPAGTPTPTGQVTISSPASGSTVSGTVSVAVQYTAPVQWLNFYIDGSWVASSPPYSMPWNSTTVSNGSHSISVNGYNSSNTLVATAGMNVNVQNGSVPPPTPTPGPTPTVKPSATPTSTSSYYSLVPAGTTLPSDSACASGAAGDTFEPRGVNAAPNNLMPTASDLSTFRSHAGGGEGGAAGSYLIRADGQFTGTTDAILKWASCKWGFDENVTRATAVNETHWRQLELGDIGNGTSIGILQIKSRDYPSTCESVASSQNTSLVTNEDCYSYKSTAFAADYKLAQQRACFEGQVSYMIGESRSGYPTYPNGTPDEMMWGCVGWWYSGHWYDSGAVNYISQVKGYLAAETWLQSGF
jgi:hypothetical protein